MIDNPSEYPPRTISVAEIRSLSKNLAVKPSDYTKPIRFYVDVDGVVMPYAYSDDEIAERFPDAVDIDIIPSSWGSDDTTNFQSGKFWYNKEIIARLAALSHSPHVDFVWLTAWRAAAPHALDELLGIKSLGYLPWEKKMSDHSQFFKQIAILKEQEVAPSKFVWIDDRANVPAWNAPHFFTTEKRDHEFEFDETGKIIGDISEGYIDLIPAQQYLNIITHPNVGLTTYQLDEMEKWVEENAQVA